MPEDVFSRWLEVAPKVTSMDFMVQEKPRTFAEQKGKDKALEPRILPWPRFSPGSGPALSRFELGLVDDLPGPGIKIVERGGLVE